MAYPYAKGVARIQHVDTGEVYEIHAGELDWQAVGGHEGSMGPETLYSAVIEHSDLGDLEWELSEYPIGVEDFRDTNVGRHLLLEDVEFGFAHEPEDQEEHEFAKSLDKRQRLVDQMVRWFFENYEDPAHEMPYDGREGGYQYIRGGPYEAREVLADRFPEASHEVLELAADEIEKDGTIDWAPVDDGSSADDLDHDFEADLEGEGDSENDESDEPPSQIPGPSFEVNDAGLIQLANSGSLGDDEAAALSDLLEELRATVDDLLAALAGTNAHGHILKAARAYRKTLDSTPPSVDRIYALGLRLINADDGLRQAIESGELPPLPMEPAEALATCLRLHGVVMQSTMRGRELLDRAREFSRSERETAENRTRRKELADAVRLSTGVFEEETQSTVTDILADEGAGPHPVRSSDMARSTERNLLVIFSRWATPVATMIFGPAFAASIPGAEAITHTTVAIDGIWTFVTTHLPLLQQLAAAHGPDMGWVQNTLATIGHFLQQMGNYSEKNQENRIFRTD